MTNNISEAGNKGQKVRSDCYVNFELTETGGIVLDLKSKVSVTYGKSIDKLCRKIIKHFEIKNAKVSITDTGSLDFVIAARLEAAIKKSISTDKEYLSEIIEENKFSTEKEQFRFSRLYLPGNTPSMMLNAGVHKPNGIILDLEDSVASEKKQEARFLIRNALRSVNFYGAERMVRINQLPLGLEDIKYVAPHYVNLILIPKCESAKQIRKVEKEVNKQRKIHGFTYPIYYMPIIESALGIEKAYKIAKASKNVVAMAIGLEDFTSDMGVQRTKEGKESLYARMRIVNACKAAKIQAIDSVFSDVADEQALIENVKVSKSLGFEGMGCIHPRQINPIHEYFAPEEKEIEKALKIVQAFNEAQKKGLGVISIGTKMIDAPVVKRAKTTIRLAENLGII